VIIAIRFNADVVQSLQMASGCGDRLAGCVVGGSGNRSPVRDRQVSIGIYIGKQGLESSFGAAASLVVVLIWLYYSTQIVLMGAEFTRAHALQRRPQNRASSRNAE
jgi:hypothetical protein